MLTYSYAKCQYNMYEATTKVYEEVICLIDEMLADTENNSLELRALKGDLYEHYMDHSKSLASWKAEYDKEQAEEDLERIRQSHGVTEET